ncbi:MAG: restriction endonuclease subunit S [Paludibacter sp.]|nr:restriction endonuclease subunit S [Paludibacter sp.]
MNNNTTYKDSPLGKIPKDWHELEFGAFVDIDKSKYNPVEYENVRCLELEHFNQGDGTINGWTNSSEQKSTKNKFEKGQVLFGKLRPYLQKYWQAEFDGVCSSEVWVLMVKNKKCNNDYLFRLIQTHKFIQVANVSSGSKMPRADWNYVSSFPFPLPPLPEQSRIAEVLGTWDKAITNLQATITQKELRNKWLMQQLLTGKKRLKGFIGEWKKVRMKDLFKRIDKVNDGDDKHSVMTISAKQGLISQEDKFDRVIAGDSLKKYTLLNKNDFAYNKGNSKTYQMGCIYQLEEIESALVPFVYICFSPTEKVYSAFYKHWFFAHGLDKQLNRIITSGARGDGLLNVNSDDFFKLKIPHPTIDEQTAIANVLQTASNEVQLLQKQLDKLREQKKGLMQVLLTGKKRLNIKN